jgi:hypothetical protein
VAHGATIASDWRTTMRSSASAPPSGGRVVAVLVACLVVGLIAGSAGAPPGVIVAIAILVTILATPTHHLIRRTTTPADHLDHDGSRREPLYRVRAAVVFLVAFVAGQASRFAGPEWLSDGLLGVSAAGAVLGLALLVTGIRSTRKSS